MPTNPSDRISVLYVDDFEPERVLLAHRLRESDIGLSTAGTVDEAIDWLNTRSFEVIITDLHLDGGRSGADLIRTCQSGGLHDGPIVVLTGESNDAQLRPLLEIGAIAVLTKPIDPAALPGIVNSLLGRVRNTRPDAIPPETFVAAMPVALEALVRSVERGDAETTKRVLRDLSSTAGSYGFTSLARLSEKAIGATESGPFAGSAAPAVGAVIDSIRGLLEPRSNAA